MRWGTEAAYNEGGPLQHSHTEGGPPPLAGHLQAAAAASLLRGPQGSLLCWPEKGDIN